MPADIDTVLSIATKPLVSNGNLLFKLGLGVHDIEGQEGADDNSVLFGLTLKPVVRCPGSGDRLPSASAGYCDACGTKIVSQYSSTGYIIPDHAATAEAIAAYDIDVQFSAIYFDATKLQIAGLIAQLQRVIDDNEWPA